MKCFTLNYKFIREIYNLNIIRRMAYANMTPDEIELRIQELINRERRVNTREAELENQTRKLQDQEQQMAAASARQNNESENERVLINQIADYDNIIREKIARERELLDRISNLERAVIQTPPQEELHTRSFVNSTLQESNNQTNPFISSKQEVVSERSNEPASTGPRILRIENVTNADPANKLLNMPYQAPLNNSFSGTTYNNNNNNANQPFFPSSTIIKEAVKAIPIFDGRNLFKFLKAIRKIKTQFPGTAEQELVSLLKFRISDSASTLIDDLQIFSVNDLIQNLKIIFAGHQSSNYYRGQLSHQAKRANEPMLSFIDRFAETYAAIVDCTCLEQGRDTLSETESGKLEKDCMQEFLYALPPEMRILMNSRNYASLPQLYAEAIRVERRVEIDRARHREQFNRHSSNNYNNYNRSNIDNSNRNDNNSANANLQNNYNNNANQGNNRDRGNNDYRGNTRNNGNQSNAGNGQRRNRVCTYCDKVGHERETCFKKQRDERESGNANARNEAGRNPSANNREVRPVNHLTTDQFSIYHPSH